MATLWQDLRYAVRMLLKKPGLTFVAILTLALGIGANTAIFSVVNAVLLKPLPYPESEQLVRVGGVNSKTGRGPGTFSPPDFYDWQSRNNVFDGLAAYDGWSPSLTRQGEPERLIAARVSANFFNVLRVSPQLGRAFLPQEEKRGNHLVAILSHNLWQRRFGADREIVGKTITLNGDSYQVVGVMPPDFEVPRFAGIGYEEPELWAPFAPDLSQWGRNGRSVDAAIGRLKPGVGLQQAQAEMVSIARALQQQYPESNVNASIGVVSLHEQLVGRVRKPLLIFLVAVGFVLLIVCANVANLQLARSTARRKEMAVRASLGASRLHIIRQLLTESILLSVVGAGLGLLLSLWATDFLVSLGSDSIPHLGKIGIDARVLSFTLLVTVLTGILFGLAPALHASKLDLNEALKEGGGKGIGGSTRSRLRDALIVSEIALSLVLLVGAALLIKSFVRLQEVNPGFNPRNVLTMYVFLPGAKYSEDEQQAAFFDESLERVQAVPGVEAVGVTSNLPISGNYDRVGFYVEDHPVASREDVPDIERYMINSDYFKALAVPIREGRTFGTEDSADSLPVAIINEMTARKYWPNESAIGKRIRTNPESPWRTIVGVAGDVKHYNLETDVNLQLYLPYKQTPSQMMTFVVRTAGDPLKQATAVRRSVWAVDKDQPVYNISTMEQLVSESVAQRRFTMTLLGIFAIIAMFLSLVGIYGVLSYTVSQRVHEIGIRVALGAQGRDVLKLILGHGMMLALIGVGLGLAGAILTTRIISSLLYGVTATDPLTFASVAISLSAAAFIACYIPARRATRVDPMVALRYE
ncbi:MAG: ABC transporter permease [Pyrinomonadaceae bacterium]|nr:ABC transporter permease [Pyrinomonadaceae bacterium]